MGDPDERDAASGSEGSWSANRRRIIKGHDRVGRRGQEAHPLRGTWHASYSDGGLAEPGDPGSGLWIDHPHRESPGLPDGRSDRRSHPERDRGHVEPGQHHRSDAGVSGPHSRGAAGLLPRQLQSRWNVPRGGGLQPGLRHVRRGHDRQADHHPRTRSLELLRGRLAQRAVPSRTPQRGQLRRLSERLDAHPG